MIDPLSTTLLYILACVVAPLVWGVAAVFVTRWIEGRFPKPKPVEPRRPHDIDYYI